MTALYLFILCLWCHVLDDYWLQGCMAKLKQRDWWRGQLTEEMVKRGTRLEDTIYRHDYIAALAMHAAQWAVSIMVPLIIVRPWEAGFYVVAWLINAPLHALVDDLKANRHLVSLVNDQLFHVLQVECTVMAWAFWAVGSRSMVT